ncbi:MAG: hypothetical protein Q7R78_00360, partial [bacterium]|nr:hypothetical protein [bacterium]
MKKENIFHYILSTVFAVAIVTGASYLYAWEGPRNVPPLDNAPAPINVSPIGQVKQGSLFLDGLNPSNVPYLYALIVAHGNGGIGTTTPGQ